MAVDPSRVRTLFQAAEALGSPVERATFLDRECGDDTELRSQVDALFATETGATGMLQPELAATVSEPTSAASDETSAPESPVEPQGADHAHTAIHEAQPAVKTGGGVVGAVIADRYKLLSVLGEGGMGTVYLAEQSQPIKRQVAIKLIKVGLDSRMVLARFDAERQALALMDHPNIARVYDGGATEANQPYFVMELVRGEPITDYCDRVRLPVRARLELFATVCQAMQHAHQKGIIHRDVKPGNVLVIEVDGRPVPKVIDFGVAKATGFSLTDRSLAETGAIVGTPTYMSPEQADPSSMDVDTRTDVYALGVILYELLTGSPPIDPSQFKRGALLEMLRMVREVDPSKPSTKVSTSDALPSIAASRGIDPEQLKRVLRGDLDWIVMKALEKDRARRYDSANGFAADVLRYLANDPVEAAPPSRGYRLRKFVRRNRVPVVAAGLVVLALLGGIAGTTWGLLEARDQALRAREETADKETALAAEALRVQERDAALEDANHQLANSRFLQAVAAYRDSDVNQALTLLDGIDAKYRGWEWRYLRRESIGGIFTLHGHTDVIRGVAYSPDGTQIVSCGDDRTARVWDARTGVLNRVLKDDAGAFLSVAFSPDGKQILTGHSDGAVRLWDARTDAVPRRFQAGRGPIAEIAFSPDGTRIATGGRGADQPNEAKVWNALTGDLLLELKGHTGAVTGVAFSPDSRQIATSSLDATARLWDAATGTPQRELKGTEPRGLLYSVAYSPDGSRVVTGGFSMTVVLWDARTGSRLLEMKGHTRPVSSVAFSPDGSRIVTASGAGASGSRAEVKVWDARIGAILLDLKGHEAGVNSVAFSPDAQTIVSGSDDRTVKVWDARTGTPRLELEFDQDDFQNGMALSPDGAWLATIGTTSGVGIWNARTGRLERDLKGSFRSRSVAFNAAGDRVVAGSDSHETRIWDPHSGAFVRELTGSTGSLDVAFSEDGGRIVTVAVDGTTKVWDARTGAIQIDLKGDATRAAFSRDGGRIVAAGRNGRTKVWDASTGAPLLDVAGNALPLFAVAFSPDGSTIATGSLDAAVRLYDGRTGQYQRSLIGHSHLVKKLVFSPDGSRVVTASDDNTAKVWDARTGNFLLELKGFASFVDAVAISADGSRIVTSGAEAVRVLDAPSAEVPIELKGHTDTVQGLAFSPDGSRIVTASMDGTAKVWDSRTASALFDLDLSGDLFDVGFSHDGARIATGGWAGVRIWDARTGALQLKLTGPKAHAGAGVAFSPDGSRLVTGLQRVDSEAPRDARVWNARTGELELELSGLPPESRVLSFSPDGRRIVTGVQGGRLSLWDARIGQEVRDEPIPTLPLHPSLSPDGKWLARHARNRVELIPLRPTAEAIADRELHTRPDLDRYRKAHEAARKANDQFATHFYFDRLPPEERTTWETWDAANRDIAEGRPREALAKLIPVSVAKPSNVELFMLVAALQAWFGQTEDLAKTRARVLAFAKDTNSMPLAYYTAKVCGMSPSTGKAELEEALTLARTGVAVRDMEWTELSLGMVEYRRGDFEAAEKTLIEAAEIFPKGLQTPIMADFYRAMVLERRGKSDDARKLAAATTARMRPIPKDEKDLLAGGTDYDDLVLWMAYKEAMTLLKLDQAPE
jgi:eukaryotic-like serine/threonine-protein kinase